MSTASVTLTGAALKAEASRLAIPGRSKMTADQLREAVSTTLATLAATAESTRTDAEYREVFDDTAEGAEVTDPGLSEWAGDMADRSLSERHSTPVPDQRPAALPPTDSLPADDWRREVREILSTPPLPMTPDVFAARWGKHKPSLHGRTRRPGR